VKDRLLAPLEIAPTPLDRRVLPANLLAGLDAAGLGGRDLLPAATLMALAAVAAAAGPSVRCEAAGDQLGPAGNTALRVVLVAPDRRASLVPSAILAATYAAENAAIDRHEQVDQLDAERRRMVADRRRLYAKACEITAVIGAPPLPPFTVVAPAPRGSRPRIVVTNGAAAAVRLAAAGGTGVMVVDERRMTSMAHVAEFYDEQSELLLTALARGDVVPVADPTTGRTTMRSLPASVIGLLTVAECALLHEVAAESYVATAFVAAAPPLRTADCSALVWLLRRIGAIGSEAVTLQLPAEMVTSAVGGWAALAASMQPPLSDWLGYLPDLLRRLAAALHLAAAAGGDGKLAGQIPVTAVKRAIVLINSIILPTAQAVLSPVSTPDDIRDARRIVAHLRAETSAKTADFDRRQLLRSWQHSMTTMRLDAAITLLEKEKLLTAVEKSGGKRYKVSPEVYT
jgi:hypothetical protein